MDQRRVPGLRRCSANAERMMSEAGLRLAASVAGLRRDLRPRTLLAYLDDENAADEAKAHHVGNDDDEIALQHAIHRPKRHARCQRDEHFQ